jgi:hypothetical protein
MEEKLVATFPKKAKAVWIHIFDESYRFGLNADTSRQAVADYLCKKFRRGILSHRYGRFCSLAFAENCTCGCPQVELTFRLHVICFNVRNRKTQTKEQPALRLGGSLTK